MQYNDKQLEIIFNKYISFVDNLDFNYEAKINNLLYLIIPAFIIKYGLEYEKVILNTFKNVPILIKDTGNKNIPASYVCIPNYKNNELILTKGVIINDYKDSHLVGLLDSLVHEYNHALNSYLNPFKFDENSIYIRTGLSNIVFAKNSLKMLKKEDAYILEEVLNTNQTEEIINIIHDFKKYTFLDNKINTALYILDNHIDTSFKSESYFLENFLTKEILKNRTFISTLSKLRIKDDIEDIEYWFNNITGIDNSYNKLIEYLLKANELTKKKNKTIFGKNKTMNKLKELYKNILEIINTFNNNCNFK